MYTNYIFDLYGTLIDIQTDEENKDVWQKLSSFYQYNGAYYTPDELHSTYLQLVDYYKSQQTHTEYPDFPLEQVFKSLFIGKDIPASHDLIISAMQLFRIVSTKYIKTYPGVFEFLDYLKSQDAKLFILSNAQREFTLKELRILNLLSYFDGVYFSSDFKTCKPDLQFFNQLIDKAHINPKNSLMIGNDFKEDCEAAYQIGMDSLYIHSNLSPKYPKDFPATYKVFRGGILRTARYLQRYHKFPENNV